MSKKLFSAGVLALLLFSFAGVKAQTVILQVDMTYQTAGQVSNTTGYFDFTKDSIDVAGTFNNWGETVNQLSQVSGTTFTYADTLSDLTVGDVIEFKFRINNEWVEHHSELWGSAPNRKLTVRKDTAKVTYIFDNYEPGLVPVYISMNMNKKIKDGGFDPATEFVDVAGTFNNWGAFDELFQDGTTGIYKGMVLAPVDTMLWKTRINADWGNSEFPNGGPNREYVVQDTAGGFVNNIEVLWYDNDSIVGVKDNPFANLSVYPNPFDNMVTFNHLAKVDRITISNIVGQEIKAIEVNNIDSYTFNTSELNTGMYIVVFHNNSGVSKAMRVIKR